MTDGDCLTPLRTCAHGVTTLSRSQTIASSITCVILEAIRAGGSGAETIYTLQWPVLCSFNVHLLQAKKLRYSYTILYMCTVQSEYTCYGPALYNNVHLLNLNSYCNVLWTTLTTLYFTCAQLNLKIHVMDQLYLLNLNTCECYGPALSSVDQER